MITNSEKVSMEISRILDTTREMPCQKVNIGVSKILIFPWAIRYDVIRYIDIEPIFQYFRYMEASLLHMSRSNPEAVLRTPVMKL